jgi:5-methylcytosine-specific restriction protein A
MCQAQHHDPRCNGIGTECDHITPGDDHSMGNLQWLNGWCHKAKTQRESLASRGHGTARQRPNEDHPGLISRSKTGVGMAPLPTPKRRPAG